MKQPHKHAEAIKAWADGAQIQTRFATDDEWVDVCSTPSWYEDLEYRVKPEPKPDDVIIAHIVRCYDMAKGWDWCSPDKCHPANLKFVFDGETGKLKAAEVI